MKFSRCCWRWDNRHRWSPQRRAAARRAVDKEAARVTAKRDEVGLFPDMQAEIQPRFTNEAERIAMVDKTEDFYTLHWRTTTFTTWCEARRAFYQLPPLRRRGMRRLWNHSSQPKNAASFACFVRQYSTPGNSPWTYLRKIRLVWLWNFGGWKKPDHFRDVTANFSTLGPVPHARISTQTLIQLAILRGTSLRTLRAERLGRL